MTETISNRPIHLGSPGEDISKKDIHRIIRRFKSINQLRRQRAQEFLQPRQQIFLDILPLLFHQNHPLFPGFSSSNTPFGIYDYTPDKLTSDAAKQFLKGFSYKRKALLSPPIQSIFLMGSVGSIAFSKTSDMDIWLCYQPGLVDADINGLQQKALAVEKWAVSLSLEIHFFLVNSETFSKGENIPISTESSGNTQHYLLLEEFYRTAIFIAGRIPAWWLVPPRQEYNYANYISHLIKNNFISENEIIDFGGLESMPAEEFISATLWHIYKSITSPHKSLLKLFLMESYVSEYPKPQWLCFYLKKAIYQGSINIDELDPYLLIYSKVEKYLQKNNSSKRINLARQCFYLKIMGSSQNTLDSKLRAFREEYIKSIAKQWCWPEDFLSRLNKQKYWDIKKATKEHIIIRSQLKHCLRIVLKLASIHISYNYRGNNDLRLIGRKLHVFLERKPGKIEQITTRSTVHSQEYELSIAEQTNTTTPNWVLYSGRYDEKTSSSDIVIKQQPTLLEMLAWLVVNGLYHKQLQLNFKSYSLDIHRAELMKILEQLFIFLSQNLKTNSTTLDIYKKPDTIVASLNIINLGSSYLNERDNGMIILSERSDPLSYGNDRYCYIKHIDRLSVSSWGEVTAYQYSGLDGFFNSLSSIFNISHQPFSENTLKTICYIPSRANSIILRADSIFKNLQAFFSNEQGAHHNRYFLPGEKSTYLFQKRDQQLYYQAFDSEQQLLQELASTQVNFGNVYFDPKVFNNPIIPYIYSLNQTQAVQVFYFSQKNNNISLFIIDEKGALFIQEHKKSDFSQVLNNYALFLKSVLIKTVYQEDIKLKFYRIKKNLTDDFSYHPATWNSSPTPLDLSIQVILEKKTQGSASTIYLASCNDTKFSSAAMGHKLFKEVTKYIMSYRQGDKDYPIYISNIDIPHTTLGLDNPMQMQTMHYLNYKKKIESKLNT